MSFTQSYSGRGLYYADFEAGPHRLDVAVACQIADLSLHALLDTGADWCVLPPGIAVALGYEVEPDPDLAPYHTRHGRLRGRQERILVSLIAEAGVSLDIQATWFISPDWPGPVLLGWKGCLERLRFALDPTPFVLYTAHLQNVLHVFRRRSHIEQGGNPGSHFERLRVDLFPVLAVPDDLSAPHFQFRCQYRIFH